MKGRAVGKYVIDELIGAGGMGAVYKAHHKDINRKAAIKVLSQQFATNPHLRERFKHEAAIMAQLNHTGIVALYDYIEEGDEAFLIMEFAEGIALDKLIEARKKLDEPFAQKLLIQMAEALAYAHSKGIIHRDIKPSNFIVNLDTQTVKILDFGIAKTLSESFRNLTKTGMRMGSIYFMSPEQVRGDKNITHRTDIYSLGLTYYVMLTGEYPLAHHTSEYAIYDEIVNKDFIDYRKLEGKVSGKSIDIIYICTQKNPQDRFATALDIVNFLKQKDSKVTAESIINRRAGKLVIEETSPRKEVEDKQKSSPKSEKKFEHPSVPTPPPQKKSFLRKILWILFVLGLLYFFFSDNWKVGKLFNSGKYSVEDLSFHDRSKMYVTVMGLNLRNSPQWGAVLATIPYGESVYIEQDTIADPDWVKVDYNGIKGYVFRHFIAEQPLPLYRVASTRAYFYQEPNLRYPTVSFVIEGQYLIAEKEKNGFIFTTFRYGDKVTTGWIYTGDLERIK